MSAASLEETKQHLDRLYSHNEKWRLFIDLCKSKIPSWLELDKNYQADKLDKEIQEILESSGGPTKIWTILSYEPSLLSSVITLLQKLYDIEDCIGCAWLFHFYTVEASFLTLTTTAFPEKNIESLFADFILREYASPLLTKESFTKLNRWYIANPDILFIYMKAFGPDAINQVKVSIENFFTSPHP